MTLLARLNVLVHLQEDSRALYECGIFGPGSGHQLDEAFK